MGAQLAFRLDIGSNGGPPLDDRPTLEEAQLNSTVQLRPSYLQRYCGPGAPKFPIVALGGLGCVGRWTLLECGHWREIRDYDLAPLLNRKRPTRAGCGCCRVGIAPTDADLMTARRFAAELASSPN